MRLTGWPMQTERRLFPIPMRGNESEAFVFASVAQRVPDPHEG